MKKLILIIATITCLNQSFYTVHAEETYNVSRISGQDRYETSVNIANYFTSDSLKNIIIASGNNFPDALSGSMLSKKLDAPILLSNDSSDKNEQSINYIKKHLQPQGNVYILGGESSISKSYEDELKLLNYNTIRLSGIDRFSTNSAIIKSTGVKKGTPVIIVNGFEFADALSISSIAAVKGYPIIMNSQDKLNDSTGKMINDIEPSKIFIIGGQSAISDIVIDDIKDSTKDLENNEIIRISGTDRYETSVNICKYFNLSNDCAVIANGDNFPDALSGSALAANLNAPIILTNGYDISTQKSYLDTTGYKNLVLLGGKSSISEDVKSKLTTTKNGVNLSNIPTLKVLSDNKNINAIIGTYSWNVDNKDGSRYGVSADSPNPEELIKRSNPLIASTNSELTLSFSDNPLNINVGIWGDNKIISQKCADNKIQLSKSKGQTIYVVEAKWKHGTVSYVFLVNVN